LGVRNAGRGGAPVDLRGDGDTVPHRPAGAAIASAISRLSGYGNSASKTRIA
jgi:hypothetical protein